MSAIIGIMPGDRTGGPLDQDILRVARTYDVAAAWMDNDFQQGNNSLCADRHIAVKGDWTGAELRSSFPTVGDNLYLFSSLDPHQKPVVVDAVFATQPGVTIVWVRAPSCEKVTYLNQITYHSPTGQLTGGDSGSPVLTIDGKIVAMTLMGQHH